MRAFDVILSTTVAVDDESTKGSNYAAERAGLIEEQSNDDFWLRDFKKQF